MLNFILRDLENAKATTLSTTNTSSYTPSPTPIVCTLYTSLLPDREAYHTMYNPRPAPLSTNNNNKPTLK